jgi:hypothetical protein
LKLADSAENLLTDGGEDVILERRPLFTPGILLVLISVRGLVDPRTYCDWILGQLKSTITSTETEPCTFRLVA